jgi:hypothetical protein
MRPWLIRALVYPVLLGLIVFLLAANPFAESEPPYWTLHGSTDQGDAIKLRLDPRGRVRTFEVTVDLYCEGGGVSNTGWHPSEGGAPARFGSRGPRFDAVERRTFTHADGSVVIVGGVLRGRVSRTRASGTVQMTRDSGGPGGPECDSAPVRWSAD